MEDVENWLARAAKAGGDAASAAALLRAVLEGHVREGPTAHVVPPKAAAADLVEAPRLREVHLVLGQPLV